ncbi:hypothetical protein [Scandinavium goeteborgense]|nr:hypothetical protein [Scandinavium goeteborgense]QKN82118.1 hypothetical protein A8O29_012780 [Scandinavium goeteborgense]
MKSSLARALRKMQPWHRTEFVHESRIIWQADAQRNVQIVNKNEISAGGK